MCIKGLCLSLQTLHSHCKEYDLFCLLIYSVKVTGPPITLEYHEKEGGDD